MRQREALPLWPRLLAFPPPPPPLRRPHPRPPPLPAPPLPPCAALTPGPLPSLRPSLARPLPGPLQALHLGFVKLIDKRENYAREMQHVAQEVAAMEGSVAG
jgi:hypothetical protein